MVANPAAFICFSVLWPLYSSVFIKIVGFLLNIIAPLFNQLPQFEHVPHGATFPAHLWAVSLHLVLRRDHFGDDAED